MTTTKEALEPCPCCAWMPQLLYNAFCFSTESTEGWKLRCDKCGLQTCWWHSQEQAFKAWNSRLSTPIVAPVVDWQPAETAPKETEILMAWEDGHLQIVYLKNEPSFWFENEPTHWAPLPAGPSAAPASTVAPVEQSTNTFDYMCDAIPNCGWRSTDTSRPIGNGIKVNCPNCLGAARFIRC